MNYKTFKQIMKASNDKISKILQKNYDNHYNKQLKYLKCPRCKSPLLKYHGKYERNIYLSSDRHAVIELNRLYCESCYRTFSLLPDYIIKFKRYVAPFIIEVISSILSSSIKKTSKELNLSKGYLRYLKNQYYERHHHALKILRIDLQHNDPFNICKLFINKFKYNFMQINTS